MVIHLVLAKTGNPKKESEPEWRVAIVEVAAMMNPAHEIEKTADEQSGENACGSNRDTRR